MVSHQPRVLLIGWDHADWRIIHRLVDQGLLPMMRQLIETGAIGELRSLQPPESTSLWTSIATGRRACDHGILGPWEFLASGRSPRPAEAATRRCPAVWNMLAKQGLRCQLVSWPATRGEQIPGGVVVSDQFFSDSAAGRTEGTPTGDIFAELASLRVRPAEIDHELIGMFVPSWNEVDWHCDQRLSRLQRHLAECLSTHAAATWLMEHQDWDFTAIRFRTIADLVPSFMPFYPPQRVGIVQQDFDLFQHVIDSIYRFLDLLLTRLIALAGPAARVILVSERGVRTTPSVSDPLTLGRSNGDPWYRHQGILAAGGPGIRSDEIIFGASILDVAPTVLKLFGLAPAEGMCGRVLEQALTTTSIEPPSADRNQLPPHQPGSLGQTLLNAQLPRDRISSDASSLNGSPFDSTIPDARHILRQNRWHFARSCCDANRWHEALPLLEALHDEWPERIDFTELLVRTQLRLGLIPEAQETADSALDLLDDECQALIVRARLAQARGDDEQALALNQAAFELRPDEPVIWRQMAQTLVKLARWDEAEAACRRILDHDETDALAWTGLSHAQLRTRRYSEAAESAGQALGLDYTLPLAHFNLGVALALSNQPEQAKEQLQTALRFHPGLVPAHRWLQKLFSREGDEQRVAEHLNQRLNLLAQANHRQEEVEQLRTASRQRAAERRQAREAFRRTSSASESASRSQQRDDSLRSADEG